MVLGPKWDQILFLAPKNSYICGKEIWSMKLTFFLRIRAKKKKLQEVPVYVRLRDENVDILQKTFLMVAPERWDPKTEDLKAKVVIPLAEREKFSDNIHELRKHIRQCYDKDVAKNLVNKDWLIKVLAKFSKQKDAPPPKEKKKYLLSMWN